MKIAASTLGVSRGVSRGVPEGFSEGVPEGFPRGSRAVEVIDLVYGAEASGAEGRARQGREGERSRYFEHAIL